MSRLAEKTNHDAIRSTIFRGEDISDRSRSLELNFTENALPGNLPAVRRLPPLSGSRLEFKP
jgi:hypothetical protein